jgi:hypothetical protein
MNKYVRITAQLYGLAVDGLFSNEANYAKVGLIDPLEP